MLDCLAVSAVLHLASYHSHDERNNENPGAGLACKTASATFSTGAYLNSFERVSPYAAVLFETSGTVRLGVTAGLAYYPPERTYTGDRIKAIGGVTLAYKQVRLLIAPELKRSTDKHGRESSGNWLAHLMIEVQLR